MLLFALAIHVAAPVAPPPLTWEAPAECPTAAHVERAVATYSLERPRAAVRAVARVRATNDGYQLSAVIDAPEGRTPVELRDVNCRVLADALALLFALHLDSPQAPPPPSVSRGERLHGHLRLFGGAATGIAPRPSGLLGLAFGLGRGPFRGELAFTHGLERASETATPGVGHTVRLWSAMVRGCWAPRSGRAEFPRSQRHRFGARGPAPHPPLAIPRPYRRASGRTAAPATDPRPRNRHPAALGPGDSSRPDTRLQRYHAHHRSTPRRRRAPARAGPTRARRGSTRRCAGAPRAARRALPRQPAPGRAPGHARVRPLSPRRPRRRRTRGRELPADPPRLRPRRSGP